MSDTNIQEFTTFDGEGGRDDYQRKPVAERIIQLLTSDVDVSPLVIDGRWGAGKTEFCIKTINLIKEGEKEYQPIYINAFKSDHTDEPLLMLIAEVVKLLPESKQEEWIKKALPALRFGTKVVGKAAVSWLFKQDAAEIADGFKGEAEEVADKLVNHTVEKVLKDHVEAEENITMLKAAIAEVAKDKALIFFVDELDRCRPDYSTSLLETIKHIFDVEGVEFVLVANLEQLQASISHVYGIGVNAKHYLDKFIKYTLVLPVLYDIRNNNHLNSSVEHMLSLLPQRSALKEERFFNLIKNLIEKNNLSLREVETFSRYLSVYGVLTKQNAFGDNFIYGVKLLRIFAVYIYCFHQDLVKKIEDGVVEYEEIVALMDAPSIKTTLSKNHYGSEEVISLVAFLEIDHDRPITDESYGDIDREALKSSLFKYFSQMHFHDPGDYFDIVWRVFNTLKLSV